MVDKVEKQERARAKTIALPATITHGGETYIELTVQEPNGKQVSEFIKALQTKTGWDAGMLLVSLVSGIPPGALEKLPSSELTEAIEFTTGFINLGAATGSPS